jgi:deoxyribose-phosphate aldolase
VSAPVDVLAVLRAVGRELRPGAAECPCHGVPEPLCPARPAAGKGAAAPDVSSLDAASVARLIDHTLLRPEATPAQVRALCREAREHAFAAVCVNPIWVRTCAAELADSGVAVASVAGFPLGASVAEVKAAEAAAAVADGAREVDMVIGIGALKAGEHRLVERDVAAVVDACRPGGALVKVIIEAALLTDEEKARAAAIAKLAGAGFVKTSTGFGPGGATVEDVALLRRVVGPGVGVKAAGGIRDWPAARAMVAAGASRIGTSSGPAILAGVTEHSCAQIGSSTRMLSRPRR